MDSPYAALNAHLSAAKRVLITTHARPDGDALGSTAAMVLGLKHKGIAADVLLLTHLPSKYAFVYTEAGISHVDVEAGFPAEFSLDPYDTFLVIDTGTWSQLPGLKPHVEAFQGRKLVVDHHLTQEDWADFKLVDTKAGAAGEIVAEVLTRWDVPIDRPIAEALYCALVSDTGWFQYSNTRPYTLRLAAQLLEAGVDADRLYQRLYQNERPERVLLQARAMQSLQLLEAGRVSLMCITRDDMAQTRATTNDTEGLINLPLQVKSVAVSVLLSDPPEGGAIRCSFRSKGQLDCSDFAAQFGGGGHARAAGAKIPGTLDDVRTRIIAALATTFAAMS